MEDTAYRAIAIVGLGAVLPDAPNVATFWENIQKGRDSVTEVASERWNPAYYYDPDPSAPDKTYSKIGGWVREHVWDPMKWHLPIPPRVADAMDDAQKWAISCTRAALEDYGYPKRPLDTERTAVIIGNAIAGEKQYLTVLRAYFPEYAHELTETSSFASLPENLREQLARELHERIAKRFPEITEDTMPGELANCIPGRIANLYNLRGPNYVCDAACASAMAAITSAVEGLVAREYDIAITGGIDRNMGPSTYIKFCKIGALSATGSRPFAEGADGFVMGEGAAIFLLKRLADAERDGDKIYAVLRGIGASSDGKGKGITAPNPIGQKLATQRAWENTGLSPATATMIEGHGTSTKVGDLVEVQSLIEILGGYHLPNGTVALGSVKSNFGHLKGAAGAAGILKTTLALHHKVLPPSIHCERKNPDFDFAHSPVFVNTELKPWEVPADKPRCAGVSAFGFGGTNFHAVLEEYIPHRITGNGKRTVAVSQSEPRTTGGGGNGHATSPAAPTLKTPLRGALLLGGASEAELVERLRAIQKEAEAGRAAAPAPPLEADLRAPERLAIDYGNAAELADKAAKALKAFQANQPGMWKALRAKGIFRGHGPAPKVAFLYTGQGSQYVNMLQPLRATEPIVTETFIEADRTMTPLLGKPLSEFIFVDKTDNGALAQAEDALRQTAITQPAVLATDIALTRLLAAYGITPDMTMGHSLGEYGALVAAGALPLGDALEAVSARGREMTRVSVGDNGKMAAVFAPLEEIERVLKTVDGYVVIANINSYGQAVIGGAGQAVEQAMAVFQKAGRHVIGLPVSHAFHTSIVAAATEPLRQTLQRLRLEAPHIPVIANISGEFYPMGPEVVPQMVDILARQVSSPVQFIKGLQTLYEAGVRIFVETGPKRALQGFVDDVFSGHHDVLSLATNHPKDDTVAFNQALCGLYAAGLGRGARAAVTAEVPVTTAAQPVEHKTEAAMPLSADRYMQLGRMFAEVLERGMKLYGAREPEPGREPVVISGAALGLPGTERIFDEENIGRILRGDQFISSIPPEFRQAMLDKHITRLVKSENGGPTFETINQVADVIKLAARGNTFDIESEFGLTSDRVAALDRVTQLAIASGIDALRDAGIPLVMRYKKTTKGTQLPDRWMLPEPMRDSTGVVFASAFPGYDSFADEMTRYYEDHARREQLAAFEDLHARVVAASGSSTLLQELDRRIKEVRAATEATPYVFERRFLFKVLAMGHSQFAEYIGARGPNTQINAACASTTQAVALAEDWIQTGRCKRVVVVSADDITSDHLLGWFGAGFLASGAAATDEQIEEAAIPFDRRRHGLIVGMGAAALIVESAEAARERGLRPICKILSTVTANSAFHGSRLDVEHIGQVMEDLISQAEAEHGISRHEIAPKMVFVSHETYTPARGGSASAEIYALRRVFGDSADRIVIANTKGFTGHAMGTGIEDVVAVKALETGLVPPVANFKEIDPELGALNLSKGGAYPVEYALHLGAGFGSQISMHLLRWLPTRDGVRRAPNALGYQYRIEDANAWKAWLARMVGSPEAELEVVNHTLRVRDNKAPMRVAAPVQTQATPKPIPTPTPMPTAVEKPAPVMVAQAPTVTPTAVPAVQAAMPMPAQPKPTPVAAAVVPAKPPIEVKLRLATPEAPPPPKEAELVKDRVLTLVSEKTGYPVEMLDLDLDLEADLGVDTVKQAEVFAAVRGEYGIPRDETLKLRDFPTLAHVIRFVHDRRPDLAQSPAETLTTREELKPATAATTPPRPAVAHTSEAVGESVKERVLALVAEKTGYPKEMLDLDLDLEADLGIDTVKQAEIFAAIRGTYNIPRDENLKLRDFPTLARVIQFVYDRRPDLAAPPQAAPTASPVPAVVAPAPQPVVETPPPAQAGADAGVKEKVLEIVAEKTGYPREMLDLDLDLEADLGIDTVKQAEMFAAIRGTYNIPRDENLKLRDFPTLAHVIQFVYDRRPDLAGASAPKEKTVEAQPSAPAAVAPEPAPPTPPVQAAPSEDEIREKVLQIVAEKTGYPKEMLDLDLDLEADLGIDTVKQAEMFAAVRSAYNIPRDENLKLRDFPTLAHVIQFARDRVGGAAKPKEAATAPPEAAPKTTVPGPEVASFDAADRIPRRVPVPNLRPPLELCKATGVTLDSGHRRFIIMPDKGGVAEALIERLRAIGAEVLRIDGTLDADALTKTLHEWLAAGPIHGVYWLPALDHEGSLNEMNLAMWRTAVHVRLKSLYTTMRALYEQISAPGTFLVSATRMGGQHGYDPAGAMAPMGGAVVGFTKTYKRERPDCLAKAVDFEPQRSAVDVAELLIAETLRDPGAVEIGYKDGLRWTVGLHEQPAADGQAGMKLDNNSVFVITGAAGSIVSAITADLAAASGGTFYLLDLVPEPDPKNPDLARFVNDKDGLKRDLFARIQARGERATPALVEKELTALERARAALDAINAVRAAGGTARYFSVNLTDANAVEMVINQVRQRSGRIDVLLHAAGMERSHFLPAKDPREFDLVFDVKSDGWFNLLHAIGDMPLGATVAFSSIAGRFGNGGQADYSSANDLLCKITSSFRGRRPATRGIVIDWTAWGGIGMATRGSIPKMMEMAGIDMLPPEAGIPLIRRELTVGGTRGEVVIGQRLGVMHNEFDPAGGLDQHAVEVSREQDLHGPMVGKITGMGLYSGLTIETTLDPKAQPFLHDHQIEGTPVLPGVVGIETFAEAALQMLSDWEIEAVEEVNFLAPFKFYRSEPRTMTVQAVIRPDGDRLIADCRLIGKRTLPNQAEPQIVTHFTGRVRLTRHEPQAMSAVVPSGPSGAVVEAADIYRLYFHGPAYQVVKRAWRDGERIVGELTTGLPVHHDPPHRPLFVAPRLIELCFQTAGLWEMGVKGRMGLPQHVREVRFALAPGTEEGRVFAVVVTPDSDGTGFDADVVDAAGNLYLSLRGYRTAALPNAIDAELLKPLQAAMAHKPAGSLKAVA